MIFYFYGKDKFLTKFEADKKIREFVDSGSKKVVLESIDDLKSAVKSNSLFSEEKVFVFITEKLNEKEKKEFKELDFSKIKDNLVFIETNGAPSLLFGRAKVDKVKSGEVDEKWLKQQARESGMNLENGLTDHWLSEQFKDCDAGYFYFEMTKLALYRPDYAWGLADYLEMSQSKQEINYFDWIKAVLEKNTAKALKFSPSEIGEALMRLKSLINIFELLLVIEDAKMIQNEKQDFLSKSNPYWVRNLRQWASKMSYQEKQKKYEQLLDFEIKVKTGKLGIGEAIKLFVMD